MSVEERDSGTYSGILDSIDDRLSEGVVGVFNVRLKMHFVWARMHFEHDVAPAREVLSQGTYLSV